MQAPPVVQPPAPEPVAPPAPAPDDVELAPRREVRSHRNGDKPSRDRADDHTSTAELKRLLGFFDEIRRARAWDEEPEPTRQEHPVAAGGHRHHR